VGLAKKSQMELLGLAIVIVLIILATIFVARFIVTKDKDSERKSYVDSEQALSTIKALISTNTECNGLTVSEIMSKCFEGNSQVYCGGTLGSPNSCEYAKLQIEAMFAGTFDEWNRDYEFLFYGQDSNSKNEIKLNEGECLGRSRKRREGSTYYLPTNLGTANIELYICS